eukprot:950575-Prorocentrum_minimum.AAC.1
MLEQKVKFLLFAHHRCLLDGLEGALRGKRVRYMRIDGATPSAQRHENVKMFQSDPDLQVALLSVTAAGQGITLTAAANVVFAELHWTPAVLAQVSA